MRPKWTGRGAHVGLGKVLNGSPLPSTASPAASFERQRYRGWRNPKPEHFGIVSSVRCSVAAQTTLLMVCSACMLLYVLLNPAEQDGWPEQPTDTYVTSSWDMRPSFHRSVQSGVQPAAKDTLAAATSTHPLPSSSSSHPAHRNPDASLPRKRPTPVSSTDTTQSSPQADNMQAHYLQPQSTGAVAKAAEEETHRTASTALPKKTAAIRLLGNSRVQVFADPTSKYFPSAVACRIHGACVTSGGRFILPKEAEEHKALLSYCGLSNFQFDNLPTREESQPFKDKDLFTNVLRYHMPHLATDVLSLSYAMSVVSGSYRMEQEVPAHSKPLRPIVQAQERIRSMTPSSWTRKMLSKLPFNTEVVTPQELFQAPNSKASIPVCPRSIISFETQVYWQVAPSRFNEDNTLFHRNEMWSRTPKRPSGQPAGTCSPVVLVLNRPPNDQRTLQNIENIRLQFERLKTDGAYSKVSESSFVVKYMNTSFADQVQTLQDADVILASHGAALANLLFARIGTPVVEVFPFTYYANIFERMAQVMGLPHERIVAEPDDGGFFSCILKQNTDKDAPSVRNVTGLRALESVWHKATRAFEQSHEYDQFVTHHHDHGGDLSGIDGIRMCARNQVLRVDARAIAQKLIRLASIACDARSVSEMRP